MVRRTNRQTKYPNLLKEPPDENKFKKGDPKTIMAAKKGAQVTNSNVWVRVKKRKRCSPKCPIYEYCPLAAASLKTEGKRCLLKQWDTQNAKRLVSFLSGDSKEYDKAVVAFMSMIYTNALLKHSDDLNLHRRLLKDMLSVRKAIFGEKHDVSVNAEVNMEEILKSIKLNMEEGDKK